MRVFILFLLLTASLLANEKVVLQLQWLNQFQFAGYYVAKEQGFYADAGLDVEIREAGADCDVVDEVLSGRSNFGVGRSSLLLDYAAGRPVAALGAVFQSSPSVLMTTDPAIKTLKDLTGRRIMVSDAQFNAVSIQAMLRSQNIHEGAYILQKQSFTLDDLIEGKTDALASYLSNEPYLLQKKGTGYRVFDPKEFGFDFYGDLLFTSKPELASHPERSRRFYQASLKGWKWAFEHIEETAAMLYRRYNTQDKSLEHLVFEGRALKKLAYAGNDTIGFISRERFKKIVDVYHLYGMIANPDVDLTHFIDPLGFNRIGVRLGVLAKRGDALTMARWQSLADYLNRTMHAYRAEIIPLDFKEVREAVRAREIDFVLTNTMQYVQLEHELGISRIATLKNRALRGHKKHKRFGGVILTRKGDRSATLESVRKSRFAAVDAESFGGWMMARELLESKGIDVDKLELIFLGTHDAVVEAVLNGDADYGTVRTDTLERMAEEGKIELDQITVVAPREYEGFTYRVSTKLYPEWPLAQLAHVDEQMARAVITALIQMPEDSVEARHAKIGGWTVPLDYTSVYKVLERLKLPPYDKQKATPREIFERYAEWFYGAAFVLLLFITRYLYLNRVNRELNRQVLERTKALMEKNAELKQLARTDALTGIFNRGYFFELAERYFSVARRNESPLQLLSLDLDHFKQINDTYGHQAGDGVLKAFCSTISPLLRESDIFGRIGGEEFAICLQNTSKEGAVKFAERILNEVRNIRYETEQGSVVQFSVSIGVASQNSDENFHQLLARSDKALYAAKHEGRDRIAVYDETS